MENGIVKKALKLGARGLLHTLGFTLSVIADALASSAKEEEYKPTQDEIARGQKLPLTGRYFIPDKNFYR